MKTKLYSSLFAFLLFASCSSLQQSAVNDDLYYSPKDEPAKSLVVSTNASETNKKTSLDNKFDKEISAILEDDTKEEIDSVIYQSEDEYENPYESIVVNSSAEAWDRRSAARFDGYYGISNSYFTRFSDDYWYAMAFMGDPFYNVVIMGNSVWVEPYYISSGFYNPYRYNYYYPYYSYYNPYRYDYYSPYYSYNWGFYSPYSNINISNDNYASSSFHSFRQRTLSGTTGVRSSLGSNSRDVRNNYLGRGISPSSSLKTGTADRAVREASTGSGRVRTTNRVEENNLAGETIRYGGAKSTSTNNIRTTNRQTKTGATSSVNRNYTRPNQSTRSTYNSPSSSGSRYNRPASTNVSSGRSSSGISRTSSRPTNRTSTTRPGSTYSPSRSSNSSGSSRSSGSVSRSSNTSTRSSGSSSGRSSGSTGSSSSSSSGSSRSGGRR